MQFDGQDCDNHPTNAKLSPRRTTFFGAFVLCGAPLNDQTHHFMFIFSSCRHEICQTASEKAAVKRVQVLTWKLH